MVIPATGRRAGSALAAAVLAACAAACATAGTAPGRDQVGEGIRSRTGHGIRAEAGTPSLPPDVALDDGLTPDEAVAVALWNSPAFEVSLADLGLARADLVEARLLRNPILSLLFPWGPKQLESTLQFPIDALWQRPRRVAAATLNAEAVGQRLVSQGLTLVADVRLAYVDAVAAERRVALATENAALAGRIADIADARLRAGDISELESRAAKSDSLQVQALLRALEHDQEAARVILISRMGFETPPAQLKLVPAPAAPPAPCGPPEALIEDALASRPDVRAAEIGVEAAGKRASWERSRVLSLIATLDANQKGSQGFEMGPGFVADIPLFARNQGGISRALAELQRASRAYLAVRMQVTSEIRVASIRFRQAQQAIEIWEKEIVPSLVIEQRQAETAYQAGEVALILVLDVNRRLVQARISQFDAFLNLQRAAVTLDQSVGRSCAGP